MVKTRPIFKNELMAAINIKYVPSQLPSKYLLTCFFLKFFMFNIWLICLIDTGHIDKELLLYEKNWADSDG